MTKKGPILLPSVTGTKFDIQGGVAAFWGSMGIGLDLGPYALFCGTPLNPPSLQKVNMGELPKLPSLLWARTVNGIGPYCNDGLKKGQ